MRYPIKILSQLSPILQGFRKKAGLTQAVVAERLGVSQQSYAKLEANPASASLKRLSAVLAVLNVEMTLSWVGAAQAESSAAERKRMFNAKEKELKSPRRVSPANSRKEVW